jgi:hypothetical protein
MFQSLNWHAQVVVEPGCGLPLSRLAAMMPQQRAVESLPLDGPPELGTQIVVGEVEPDFFVPKKKKSGWPPDETFSGWKSR